MKKPFDLLLDCNTNSEWLGLLDTLRTQNFDYNIANQDKIDLSNMGIN